MQKTCTIEYFKNGESLGTYPLKTASTQKDRDSVIGADYDKFIIDNGRVTAWKTDNMIFFVATSTENTTLFNNAGWYTGEEYLGGVDKNGRYTPGKDVEGVEVLED